MNTNTNTSLPHLPMVNILPLRDTDVVFGRGGASIHNKGNIRFRKFVRSHQKEYISYDDIRHKKTSLSHGLVMEWPGRFLKKNEDTGLWCHVSVNDARRKTAQLLREGAKKARQEIRAQSNGSSDESDSPTKKRKTSFSSETVETSNKHSDSDSRNVCVGFAAFLSEPSNATVEPLAVSSDLATVGLLGDLKSIVRSSTASNIDRPFNDGDKKSSLELFEAVFEDVLDTSIKIFKYGTKLDSLELLETFFEDILDDTTQSLEDIPHARDSQ